MLLLFRAAEVRRQRRKKRLAECQEQSEKRAREGRTQDAATEKAEEEQR